MIAPEVGGGFGSKLDVYAEELLAVALARRLGGPCGGRRSAPRDIKRPSTAAAIQDIELAADQRRQAPRFRADVNAQMGAYLQLVTPGIPLLGAFLYAGVYDIRRLLASTCTGVFTTMTPTDAYRGAGRPEATYAIERAMDTLARELGIDPVELRRRNYIAASSPTSPPASSYRLRRLPRRRSTRRSSMLDYDALRAEQAARRERGDTVHLGIGVLDLRRDVRPRAVAASWRRSNYAAGGWESATVRIPADRQGPGRHRHVAARPGPRDVLVDDRRRPARRRPRRRRGAALRHRDHPARDRHLRLPLAGRRRASRSGMRPEGDRQGTPIAAHQLEVAREDLEFDARRVPRAGRAAEGDGVRRSPSPRSPPTTCPTGWSRTSRTSHVYDPPNFSWPFGTHIRVVEVDEETGDARLVRYVAVDDCGNQINPLIVEGQVHGGVAQGIAAALYEEAVYDDDGNLMTATLRLPRAVGRRGAGFELDPP